MSRRERYKERILELRSENKSYREIEKLLGCSKGTIAYHLGEGQKEKTKEKKEKRMKVLRDYKESNPCADCGGKFRYCQMDFDHLSDTEVKTWLSQMKGCSWETLEKEIQKCELVCANCHRLRTFNRMQIQAPLE